MYKIYLFFPINSPVILGEKTALKWGFPATGKRTLFFEKNSLRKKVFKLSEIVYAALVVFTVIYTYSACCVWVQ